MVKSFLQRRSGLVLKLEQGRGLAAESLTGPSPHTFSPRMGCYWKPRGIRRGLAQAHRARGHVKGPCQISSPPSRLNLMQRAFKWCTRAISALPPLSALHNFALATMASAFVCSFSLSSLRSRSGENPPACSWADLIRFLWLLTCYITPCAFHESTYLVLNPVLMPRERGKPRRGSPWRPRRPSLSPPGPLPPSSTLVPWLASPPQPIHPAYEEPILGPRLSANLPRSSAEDPPPPRRPGNYEHQEPVSNTGVQLRDSLDNIYDLVFELRKEVDDLHFRVQFTTTKVTTLLHLMASMRATFPSHPGGGSSTEMPSAAPQEGNIRQQRTEAAGMEGTASATASVASASRQQQEAASALERVVDSVNSEMTWDFGPTYIEEEPWPGDLSATHQDPPSGV
jgi:hypothetical protein